jgi:nucleotide-binding universal stress UspA family protein
MYKHILVTLDGSSNSEAVLVEAARLAGPETKVTLFSVAELSPAVTPPPHALVVGAVPAPGGVVNLPEQAPYESRDQAIVRAKTERLEYLAPHAVALRDAGLDVAVEVSLGEAAEEVIRRAKAPDVDVIMMATHGRTGLGRLVFGSVAERILREAGKPVLLVRPDGLK